MGTTNEASSSIQGYQLASIALEDRPTAFPLAARAERKPERAWTLLVRSGLAEAGRDVHAALPTRNDLSKAYQGRQRRHLSTIQVRLFVSTLSISVALASVLYDWECCFSTFRATPAACLAASPPQSHLPFEQRE